MYNVWFGRCRRRRRVRFNLFFLLIIFSLFLLLLLVSLFFEYRTRKIKTTTSHFYPFSLFPTPPLPKTKRKENSTNLLSPLLLLPQQPIIIINPLLQRLDNQLLSLPLRRLLSPRPHHQPFPSPHLLLLLFLPSTTRHLQQHLHHLPPLDEPQPVSKTIVLQWGFCVSRTDV